MQSLADLQKRTKNAREDDRLVTIVQITESPSQADRMALELEYPLSLVGEVRHLAVLKRDYSDIFSHDFGDAPQVEPSLTNPKEILCYFGRYSFGGPRVHDPTEQGVLVFRPHPFLPPLFWDYEIKDEEGKTLFSTAPHINESFTGYGNDNDGVRIQLTAGTNSLPIGLVINFESDIDVGVSLTFKVSKGEAASRWHRFVPMEKSRKSESFNWEHIPGRRFANHDSSVLLRKLSSNELEVLFGEKSLRLGGEYILTVEHCLGCSVNDKDMVFELTAHYQFKSPWYKEWPEYIYCKKLFAPGSRESGNMPLFRPFNTLISCIPGNGSGITVCDEPLEASVQDFIDGTPKEIDGLATMRKFFSFKKSVFNSYNTEPFREFDPNLVPWGWEKKH